MPHFQALYDFSVQYSAGLFASILPTISCGPCYSHQLLTAEVQFRYHDSQRAFNFGKFKKGQISLPILQFPLASNTEPMHHIHSSYRKGPIKATVTERQISSHYEKK
jgi:hypothetical protein